jgi:GTPase SAR1 family protein
MIVDNRMSFVEVIDTAGQGEHNLILAFYRARIHSHPSRGVRDPAGPMGPVSPPRFSRFLFSAHMRSRASHREGQGFVLVYSIASRATFDRLETFRQSMLRVKRSEPVFMLVGNKCDKAYEREVSREEGAALARKFGCEFLETSAKTAQNVERLFTNLVRTLRMHKESQSLAAGFPQALPAPSALPPKKKKIRCMVL